ncbi:hypothetical protein BJX99DRAFT_236161 [Aspergillus californicus]
MLLGWVDPHVRTLGDRFLRAELLGVQARQGNLWGPNRGYVDIITDSRKNKYWRAYPGQSKDLLGRIKTHNRAICAGRKAHCTTMPLRRDKIVEQQTGLSFGKCQSTLSYHASPGLVLEMTMCCAFQSLPGAILEVYYGPSEDEKPYSNLGLNIIPPVFRGPPLDLQYGSTYL